MFAKYWFEFARVLSTQTQLMVVLALVYKWFEHSNRAMLPRENMYWGSEETLWWRRSRLSTMFNSLYVGVMNLASKGYVVITVYFQRICGHHGIFQYSF